VINSGKFKNRLENMQKKLQRSAEKIRSSMGSQVKSSAVNAPNKQGNTVHDGSRETERRSLMKPVQDSTLDRDNSERASEVDPEVMISENHFGVTKRINTKDSINLFREEESIKPPKS
jgi:hypothetical protein